MSAEVKRGMAFYKSVGQVLVKGKSPTGSRPRAG
jgi:hypothetical protein